MDCYVWNATCSVQPNVRDCTMPTRTETSTAILDAFRAVESREYLRKPLEIARRGGLLDGDLQPTEVLRKEGKPNHRALVYLVVQMFRYINRGKPKVAQYTHEFAIFMNLWGGRNYAQIAQRVGGNRKRPTDAEILIDKVFEMYRYA